MRHSGLLFALIAAAAFAADSRLESTLQQVAKYNYDQGRQPLLDLEEIMRGMPAAQAEQRFLQFLKSDATIAGKDFICRQLSVIGSDASVPVLAGMLASDETVEMARYALERIPGSASLKALRDALPNAPEKARPGIVNTLGIRRDAAATDAIAKLTASPDKQLASSAVFALGRIASPGALKTLAALRKQGSLPAMEASLIAAKHLQSAPALEIYRELAAPSTPAMMRIGALNGLAAVSGKEALKPLRAAAADSSTAVQAAAIRSLSGISGAEVTSAMVEDLGSLGIPGRVRMVTALAHRGDRAAIPAIRKAASDEALEVRIASLDGLAVISDPSTVAMLAERASSASLDDAEKTAARNALNRMRGEDVDAAIVAGIGSASTPVKIELIRSAGERGIQKSAGVILASVKDSDRTLRRESFRALRETAGPAQVAPLLELLMTTKLQSERREVERALSSALRRSPPERSADVVGAYQKTQATDVRSSLLQVMGQSGAAQVLPVLLTATKDANPDIVRGAILGLTDWPGEEPMKNLLAMAGETQNNTHRILAIRGFLKLVELPSARPADQTVNLLTAAMKLATQPDEKKAILGLLPRYPTAGGLALARASADDPAVGNEAKMAVQRLERTLRPR